MQEVVKKLIELGKTISTMESCTGGGVANAITNIEGVSAAIKFSAVTYSNEFKIKMGVNKDTIDKYTVYRKEVAREMSKAISNFANSDYGVGVTGKLKRFDKNNLYGEDDAIFIAIYDKAKDQIHDFKVKATANTRVENKAIVISTIEKELLKILNEND